MLLTNNQNLIEECNIYKHDGRKERGHDLIEKRGFNFRLTEFQAAVGVSQLSKGNSFADRKVKHLATYRQNLSDISDIKIFDFGKGVVPHRIVAMTVDSEDLITYLVNEGIGARKLFKPMHSQPCYGVVDSYPISEDLFKRGLELPSYPELSTAQIKLICDSIKYFFKGAN